MTKKARSNRTPMRVIVEEELFHNGYEGQGVVQGRGKKGGENGRRDWEVKVKGERSWKGERDEEKQENRGEER